MSNSTREAPISAGSIENDRDSAPNYETFDSAALGKKRPTAPERRPVPTWARAIRAIFGFAAGLGLIALSFASPTWTIVVIATLGLAYGFDRVGVALFDRWRPHRTATALLGVAVIAVSGLALFSREASLGVASALIAATAFVLGARTTKLAWSRTEPTPTRLRAGTFAAMWFVVTGIVLAEWPVAASWTAGTFIGLAIMDASIRSRPFRGLDVFRYDMRNAADLPTEEASSDHVDDLAKARRSPTEVYDSPKEVLEDESRTVVDKEAILRSWKLDAEQRLGATAENMGRTDNGIPNRSTAAEQLSQASRCLDELIESQRKSA